MIPYNEYEREPDMPQSRPVTSDDVLQIAGNLDDSKIADILATKATVAELIEARQWLLSNDTPELHRQKSARVLRLCEILESALPAED